VKDKLKNEFMLEDDVVIESAFRMGRRRRQSKKPGEKQDNITEGAGETEGQGVATAAGPRPRPMMVRFMSLSDKRKVKTAGRENLDREGDLRVADDLSLKVRETRKLLIPHLIQFRKQYGDKKDVYLRYDKLVVGQIVYVLDETGKNIVNERDYQP